MGQLVLATAGAIGGKIGGSLLGYAVAGPIGAQVGGALGTLIGEVAGGLIGRRLFGKQEDVPTTPPKLQYQTSTYGATIPKVYGTFPLKGNLLWATEIREIVPAGSVGVGVGGKGGGIVGQEPAAPVYVASFAISFAEGPISQVLRIWADGHLIYSIVGSAPFVSPKLNDKFKIYLGDEEQMPDPTIEAEEGAGMVPPYRGVAYAVFSDFPLEDFGFRIPELRFEIVSSASAQYQVEAIDLGGTDADNHVLSRNSQYGFALADDILTRFSRTEYEIVSQSSLHDLQGLTTGTDSFGKLVLSYDDHLYVLVTTASDESYILKFGGTIFAFKRSNFTDRLPGPASEQDGIVLNQRLYTADLEGAKIRCYQTSTLEREWTRDGPDPEATPGNFTVDDSGNLWLISWLDSDDTQFFLTKCSAFGEVEHFTITGQDRCKQLAYDPAQDRLIAGGGDGGRLVKITLSGSVVTSILDVSGPSLRSCFVSQYRIANQRFWTRFGTDLFQVNVGSMTVEQELAAALFSSPALDGFAFDDVPLNAIWVADGDDLKALLLDRYGADSITVGAAVGDICLKAGLEADDIDTTALTDTLEGYALTARSAAKDLLDPLLAAFSAFPREEDFKIEFLKHGGSSVASIPEVDLGAHEYGTAPPELVDEERAQETELPRRVRVAYLDPTRDYAESTQQAQRPAEIVQTREELQIQLPLVLTRSQAKQLAEKILYSAWVARHAISFAVGPKWARLSAGDIVTVTVGSTSFKAKITQADQGANWILRCQAPLEEPSTYVSDATGAEAPTGVSAIIIPEPTILIILDMPVLRDLDDNPGFYVVVAPAGAGAWPGAILYRSLGGLAFEPYLTLTTAATIGVCQGALPAEPTANPYVLNEGYTLRVRLVHGSLASVTEEELLNGANLAAVGSEEKGWEVIGFQTATLVSPGVYDLSNFLRGRRGTEWAMADRAIGDVFVLLSEASLRRVVPQELEIGAERIYRAATIGLPVEAAPEVRFTNEAVGLECYAPAEIAGSRVSNDDWHLTWKRRARIGGGWQSLVDVPLGEASESYEVDILDGVGGAVKRTLSAGAPPSTSGVNLQVIASDSSFNRASGSFLTDGWLVGMWLESSGFTNGANNAMVRVTAVTALKITVDMVPAALVDEASAAGRVLSGLVPGVNYTIAQQTVDFGQGGTDVVDFVVYQKSAKVGRGYGTTAHIT